MTISVFDEFRIKRNSRKQQKTAENSRKSLKA